MSGQSRAGWPGSIAGLLTGSLALGVCLVSPASSQMIDAESPAAVPATAVPGPVFLPSPARPAVPAFAAGWRDPAFSLPHDGRAGTRSGPDTPLAVAPDPRPFLLRSFGERLMARMTHEARRHSTGALLTIRDDDGAPDSILEAERADHAERILGRALNRSMDEQLEQVARTSWGLAPAFDWLEDFGHDRRARSAAPADHVGPGAAAPPSDRFDGSVGFRVGAHPRLILRGTYRGFRARIDVPILEDEIHLAIDRPIGPHGRAALVGTFPRGEPGRAFLGFTFNY